MSITENVILEAYRRRFSRRGIIDWRAARAFAETMIRDYDVKCPSPEARIRLLSGGNMQKLILGRALDGDPASSSPTSRRAASMSARSPMSIAASSRRASAVPQFC